MTFLIQFCVLINLRALSATVKVKSQSRLHIDVRMARKKLPKSCFPSTTMTCFGISSFIFTIAFQLLGVWYFQAVRQFLLEMDNKKYPINFQPK